MILFPAAKLSHTNTKKPSPQHTNFACKISISVLPTPPPFCKGGLNYTIEI